MAKVYSHIFSKLSGSAAGVTCQGGPGPGIQLRSKPIPKNRSTHHQSKSRSNFSSAMSAFAQLTDSQRQLWLDASSNYNTQKSGFPITLNASQLYIKWRIIAEFYHQHNRFASIPDNPPLSPITIPLTLSASLRPVHGQTGIRMFIHNGSPHYVDAVLRFSIAYPTARSKSPSTFPPNNLVWGQIPANYTRRFDVYGLNPNLKYFTTTSSLMITPYAAFSNTINFSFIAIAR